MALRCTEFSCQFMCVCFYNLYNFFVICIGYDFTLYKGCVS